MGAPAPGVGDTASLMRRGAIALALVAVAGCSLVVDTEGLFEPPPAPGDAGDAGTVVPPVLEAGVRDSARDAEETRSDAGDAGIPDAAEAGPPVGCTGSTSFLCADFDQGDVRRVFDDAPLSGGSTITADERQRISGTLSARFRTPAAPGVTHFARLAKNLTPIPRRVDVSFHLFMCSLVDGEAYEIMKLEELTGGGGVMINANPAGGSIGLEITGSTADFGEPFTRPLPLARWTKVNVSVTFATDATGEVAVSFDGEETFRRGGIPTFGATAGGIGRIIFGLWTADARTVCGSHFDDIRVDVTP